jgi:hypothetical protein
MPGMERYVYGPRGLGTLLPDLLRPVFRRRSAATAQILADWEAIVGPVLAAQCLPKRVTAGTLTLACTGPVALELQHLSEALLARINGRFGQTVVQRLRFVQEAMAVPVQAAPRAPAGAAASRAVAGLPPGELRDALERLGRVVLTDRPA